MRTRNAYLYGHIATAFGFYKRIGQEEIQHRYPWVAGQIHIAFWSCCWKEAQNCPKYTQKRNLVTCRMYAIGMQISWKRVL